MTKQPNSVLLLSEVRYDGDFEMLDQPTYAVLELTPALLEVFQRRCRLLHELYLLDSNLYEASFWFYGFDYYCFDEQLSELSSSDGWVPITAEQLPPESDDEDAPVRARVECEQLTIAVDRQQLRTREFPPEAFELAGLMVPKHTSVYGKTQLVTLADLERFLGGDDV